MKKQKESERGIRIIGAGKPTEIKAQEFAKKVKAIRNELPQRPTFEVNGVKYTTKNVEKMPELSVESMKMAKLVTSMMYLPFINPYGVAPYLRERRLPQGTDIIKEYGRIQLKQSKLSAWERDRVVHIFERHYVKLESVD